MEQWLQAQPSPDSSPQSPDSLRQVVVGMRRVVYANPKICRPSPQVQPNLTRRLLQMLGYVLGCGNFAACMIIYFLSLTCLLTYHIYPLLFALGSFFPQLFCQENLCFGSERCFGSKNLAQSPTLPIAVGSACIAASVNVCACENAHKLDWLCGKYSSVMAASTSVCCQH